MYKQLLKKILKGLLDCVEIYIPVLTFSAMLIVFLIGVFFRFVMNNPLAWTFELQRFLFIWTLLLGACLARHQHAHISFDLIYDRFSPLGKVLSRIISNLIIAITFSIAWYPSFTYIRSLDFRFSTVLRIPYNYIFYPFLGFLIIIIGHSLVDIFSDAKVLLRGKL